VFGYLLGRAIISFILLPHYFRGDLFTAYQLMDRRFGPRLRSLTAGLFLITRAAAEGVRVFAVAIVVGIALSGMLSGFSSFDRDLAAITVVTALTLIYTFEGGMTAVIWTDVVQMFIYIAGTMIGVFTILQRSPGDWSSTLSLAMSWGTSHMFDFGFHFWKTYTFWSGLIGGAFLTTASHGTDQLIVQRLLAAKNEAQSKLALLSSGVFVFFQFSLFLLIGALLRVFYGWSGHTPHVGTSDRIFPNFIVTQMPHGLSGLLIAAILAAAMSNLSAALNSLSSSSMIDFLFRLKPRFTDTQRVSLSRIATIVWGLVLFGLAILARWRGGRVIEVGLSIASVAYGALLGVFLLGVLTKKANERGAMVGFFVGFVLNLYIWLFTKVPFTWYVLIGSLVTFTVGYTSSLAFPQPQPTESESSHA